LAPKNEFINLYINNVRKGVFHLIENFDKYFLQNNQRVQGDIYTLDEYKDLKESFFGEIYWIKKSFDRNKDKLNRENLIGVIHCLKVKCKNITDYVDEEIF
jgi:hypothetical protein